MITQSKTSARGVRAVCWMVAAAILLVPAIAMQFTGEVAWGPGDFLVMGGMLVLLCLAVEGVARLDARLYAKVFGTLAVVLVFLAIWAELAVGLFD